MAIATATERKIQVIAILLGCQSLLYFLLGILGVIGGSGYGEYGHLFVMCAAYGFITYHLVTTRNKHIRWLALFFTGLAMFRLVFFGGLFALLEPAGFSSVSKLLPVIDVMVFDLVPFVLLIQKDVRDQFAT